MNLSPAAAAAVFNEWAKRYSEDPASFGPILDADGKPVTDYGDQCVGYFEVVRADMERLGTLPA